MGIMDLFKKKTSGNVAKDRLKLVLVSDRANCSSEMMEMMKNDIIEVISRYMDIDAEALDVKSPRQSPIPITERYRHLLLIFRSVI